jgi:hypothetical protein
MHDSIDRLPDKNVFRYVVLIETKAIMSQKMRNVINTSSQEIIKADYLMLLIDQTVALITMRIFGSQLLRGHNTYLSGPGSPRDTYYVPGEKRLS